MKDTTTKRPATESQGTTELPKSIPDSHQNRPQITVEYESMEKETRESMEKVNCESSENNSLENMENTTKETTENEADTRPE